MRIMKSLKKGFSLCSEIYYSCSLIFEPDKILEELETHDFSRRASDDEVLTVVLDGQSCHGAVQNSALSLEKKFSLLGIHPIDEDFAFFGSHCNQRCDPDS